MKITANQAKELMDRHAYPGLESNYEVICDTIKRHASLGLKDIELHIDQVNPESAKQLSIDGFYIYLKDKENPDTVKISWMDLDSIMDSLDDDSDEGLIIKYTPKDKK